MNDESDNQEYREDLRAHGDCRDCEAPLLASEANNSRCGVCRAKRNAQKAARRGDSPELVRAANERILEASRARIRVLGYDDGAGSRERVRRFARTPMGRRRDGYAGRRE